MTDEELFEIEQEAERLRHCQDGNHIVNVPLGYDNPFECYGQFRCACGCEQILRCPGGRYCRARIFKLGGFLQTKAVREWMRLGLCVCPFVVKNYDRPSGDARDAVRLSDYAFNKASGNWSASRRRKLIRCPCGAYFCNDAARAAGLYSESEWARRGYPHFRRKGDDVSRYYLDPLTSSRTPYYGRRRVLPNGSDCPFTHVRRGPQPTARIWRAFYEPRTQRWEQGIHSVDLFTVEQMDLSRFELSAKQAIALMDGDKEVAKLVEQHQKPKRKRHRPFDPKEAARQYEEETGFQRPRN